MSNNYNSDGYIMIDLSDVDVTKSTQNVPGIYSRILNVIDANKLILIVNHKGLTPQAAICNKLLNYYVITTNLYIYKINSNDIVIIEQAGSSSVEVSIIPTLMSGTKIADFAIGSVEGELFAPKPESDINDNVTALNSTWSSEKINGKLALKADAADVYTKSQVDSALSSKADAADVYTKSQVDSALSSKADAADVYTKSQVDSALSNKADAADVYTKTEVDIALSGTVITSDVTLNSDMSLVQGQIYRIGSLITINVVLKANQSIPNNASIWTGLPKAKGNYRFSKGTADGVYYATDWTSGGLFMDNNTDIIGNFTAVNANKYIFVNCSYITSD